MIGPYSTSHAFRMALETRLRNIAQQQGTDLQRLRCRVAFERLLARLFAKEDPSWLLKGGYALELRLHGRARSTRDLDLSILDPEDLFSATAVEKSRSRAERIYEHLQLAAERALSDGFQFQIRPPRRERGGAPGGNVRCSVEARLAGRTFARFHVDVGWGDVVLDEPEWVEGTALLDFADIPAARVALYPLAQQFAEKIHAYTFPWQDRDNTRVKDLVDLVLLVHSEDLDPERTRRALHATFRTRGTHPLMPHLPEPPSDWAPSYQALAQEIGLSILTLREAYACLESYWQEWRLALANSDGTV